MSICLCQNVAICRRQLHTHTHKHTSNANGKNKRWKLVEFDLTTSMIMLMFISRVKYTHKNHEPTNQPTNQHCKLRDQKRTRQEKYFNIANRIRNAMRSLYKNLPSNTRVYSHCVNYLLSRVATATNFTPNVDRLKTVICGYLRVFFDNPRCIFLAGEIQTNEERRQNYGKWVK